MPIYEINPLIDPRWNELVRRHPASSEYFTAGTGWRLLSRSYGYEPGGVTTAAASRQVLQNGIVFCRIKSVFTGSRVVSLPFSDHCQPLAGTCGELSELIQSIRELVAAKGWKYLELRPVEDIGAEVPMGLGAKFDILPSQTGSTTGRRCALSQLPQELRSKKDSARPTRQDDP